MDRNQMAVLERLADALGGVGVQSREKATGFPSGTPQGPYLTGPGGLWGVPGVSRDIISTRLQPRGLASRLPARPSNDMYPLFPYITGFLSDTGADPNGVCDDAKTAGPMKGGLQTAQFGRYERQTRELEVNQQNQRTNRGEFWDLRLVNDPLFQSMGGNDLTSPSSIPGGFPALQRMVLQRMIEVGVSFQNLLSVQLYQGNPANNSSGGGYAEFPGLDILIGTGKKDALNGASMPSLNSTLVNYNYGNVSAAPSSGNDIVNVLSYTMRNLRFIADRTNMSPVDWAFVMRPSLWWEVSAAWPCSYLTYRCQFRTADGNDRLNVNAADQVAMRDDMRNGMYLMIDGIRYDVILDDGIFEDTNTTSSKVASGNFASDIYIVPLTGAGGYPLTYWEYFDQQAGAMQAVADGNIGSGWFWTDGGRYLWHFKPPVNFCVQWIAKIEPRVILHAPHLAARVQHIQYSPLAHERDPYPTSPYFVDGGVSTGRPVPSLYAEWKQ